MTTMRQITELAAVNFHASSCRLACGISAVNTPLPSAHWEPARVPPAAVMPSLEESAHVHITLKDEAFPADAGRVTAPVPCPDPVYRVFDPAGTGDWTGSGRRSGDVGGCAGVWTAPVFVVAL
ncbi:hypothetical protein [Streptomyces sp. LaBMicrA B280]|uniref:hypothetical protein n=1 Tax=Streptomyces sp. LaBMicrA B280 TaxID=3391001 RepID=UPI003BA565B3